MSSSLVLRNPSAGFTRPNDTTAYASGDLVANSVTAGSVLAVPLQVSRSKNGSVKIPRVRLQKSGTTPTNAQFRVHLFRSTSPSSAGPTVTGGDNAAFVPDIAQYIGSADITMIAGKDGCAGQAVLGNQSATPQAWEALVQMAGDSRVFALVEARAAYTPIALEVFTVILEVEPTN